MSAIEVRELGGIKRPQARHRWLNAKYRELADIFEESPFNHIEPGEGETGLIGCGIGYTYVKEAARDFDKTYPLMKLNTLPIPERKVLSLHSKAGCESSFSKKLSRRGKPDQTAVQRPQLNVDVLGRSGFYASDGELTPQMVTDAVRSANPKLCVRNEIPDIALGIEVPVRTRTPVRGLLPQGHALQCQTRGAQIQRYSLRRHRMS